MTTISKKQNLLANLFAKNIPVESTDYEDSLPDATQMEVASQNTDEGSGSKAEKCIFQNVWMSEFLWLIDDSNNEVMYCYVCRKTGPDIDGKAEFVTGKKFKRESLVYHNKTKSLKHENCFNVVSEKAHSSTKLVKSSVSFRALIIMYK